MENLQVIELTTLEDQRRNDYVRALTSSVDILSKEPGNTRLPLQVSHARGGLPVLSHEDTIDTRSIAVVANCGALSFNSPAFVDPRFDPQLAEVIAYDRVAYGPRMMAYTLSQDKFIYESFDSKRSVDILGKIADSYAQIELEVTRNFVQVHSVDAWMKGQRGGKTPILGNAHDPLLLAHFGRNFSQEQGFFEKGLRHAAAYTKNAMTQHWENAGVPVPDTYYYSLNGNRQGVISDITEKLGEQGYTHAVVSTFDGAGGDGVRFIDLQNVSSELSGRFEKGNIMVQGLLPLQESPCLIANISPDEITPLLLSRQRFASPGAHGGNVWESGQHVFDEFPDDFSDVTIRALIALQQAGIEGQVNIDPLVVTKKTQEKFNLSALTLMREANIRPAGSSVILRMRQGFVDGLPVTRVATTAVKIPYELVQSPAFLAFLNSQSEHGIRVVFYGYDIHSDKASLAFVCGEGIDSQKADTVERATLAMFG